MTELGGGTGRRFANGGKESVVRFQRWKKGNRRQANGKCPRKKASETHRWSKKSNEKKVTHNTTGKESWRSARG